MENALGFQQVMVGAVALNDGGLRQLFGKRQAFVFVLLHNGDVRADVGKRPGKIQGDAAAAEDAHAADRRHGPPHRAQHARRLRGRADDVHAVARLRDERAVRHDDLLAALGGAEQDAVGRFAVEFDQRLAHKAVGRLGLEADHFHQPARKRFYAEGVRHAQDARDLLRGGMLGVDDHIKPDLAAQNGRVAEILRVAHARHGVLCAQLLCHQAADQVHLVVFRNGDEQIRLAHARLKQDARACAVALHAHNVEHGVGMVKRGAALIDDNEIVILARHLFGNGVAHLAETDNDDFHMV